MSKEKIRIGVVSDVVCPWCYIGKRRLEKAIQKLSDRFDFEVEYFPFELNPQIPASGLDQKDYLIKKFGGEDRYRQLTDHVSKVAAVDGLRFDYNAQKISPNTRNAHRLIQLSKEDNRHLELVEALFKAFFTDGIDLSKTDNLIRLAESVGMDKARVEQFLNSNTGVVEVEMAEQELHKLGITGVPFYIVNNKYGISGAQPSEAFIKAFNEISSPSELVSDETCEADGKNC
jgi:predicted DsbA family dithiol-disulfide isomerase